MPSAKEVVSSYLKVSTDLQQPSVIEREHEEMRVLTMGEAVARRLKSIKQPQKMFNFALALDEAKLPDLSEKAYELLKGMGYDDKGKQIVSAKSIVSSYLKISGGSVAWEAKVRAAMTAKGWKIHKGSMGPKGNYFAVVDRNGKPVNDNSYKSQHQAFMDAAFILGLASTSIKHDKEILVPNEEVASLKISDTNRKYFWPIL